MIQVILKRPGEAPCMVLVENELRPLQDLVEGYIETVRLFSDTVILCNEEALLLYMPYNCKISGIKFHGPIAFVGTKRDEFGSVPMDLIKLHTIMPQLWEEDDE